MILKSLYLFEGFTLEDKAVQSLRKDGNRVHLTDKEFRILYCLVSRAAGQSRQLVPRDEIRRDVYGQREEDSIPQHIYHLKGRLGQTTEGRQYIEAVPGSGYYISVPVSRRF